MDVKGEGPAQGGGLRLCKTRGAAAEVMAVKRRRWIGMELMVGAKGPVGRR